ncbi:MAG: hypothetical protein Q8N99_08595 [Nanoarchaeota archaeon]|nr:hypothetical protein [Nanoarchaeota archaeon]
MIFKRFFLILGLVLISIAAVNVVLAKPLTQSVCPILSDTNVVIYGDTGFGGVGDISKSWITHFMDWWKSYDPSIKYVFLDKTDVKTDCNLANYPNVKVYIQPGGNAYYQQNSLSIAGKNNIKNYISSGKGYVGICAGFYYTALDYYWQGSYYNWPDLLGLYPTVEGSITDIADYDQNPGYALTSVSNGEQMIYYGGPTRGWRQTPTDYPGNALLTYTSIPNNLPASIKYNNMLLMSVHAEAYENDGITGLSTEQRIRNYIWFANAINSVAGTNFITPQPLQPECNDGRDNDNDGLVDLADLGCINSSDNDESNCGDSVCEGGETWQTCSADCLVPQCADGIDNDNDSKIDYPNDPGCISFDDNSEVDGPINLFYDDFESGTLTGWTLTKVSGANYWIASSTNPYQGTKHAQCQPMSTTEPASIIERAVSTSGYNNIKVSYYRRLIGLDSADEFKAKWYDGTTWQILEQTGTNSANDASYVYKEYVLPSIASNNLNFKLRFECTAGAVSEFCRVDNVKLTSN